MTQPSILVYKTADDALVALADYFLQLARQALDERGRFSVALSGGSSPKKLYELLASAPYRDQIDWTKVAFFFGDERNVPADHPDNNALMAKKALFEPLNISASQIYAIDTSLPPDEAAQRYTEVIRDFFQTERGRFDLVLLGLGDNSHTASLFPHTPVLNDNEPAVKAVFLPDQQVYRITLTAPLINLAWQIAFLVYGQGKAEAVRHILQDAPNVAEYPAQLIRPVEGYVHWFLDEPAASALR